MATSIAPRWIFPRPQCTSHGDVGARSTEMWRRGVRLSPLSSRLLSVLVIFSAADALFDHIARPTGFAGASTCLHALLFRSGDFDIECAATPSAAGELDRHHLSWPAGKPVDAPAGHAVLSGRAGSNCA